MVNSFCVLNVGKNKGLVVIYNMNIILVISIILSLIAVLGIYFIFKQKKSFEKASFLKIKVGKPINKV